MEKYLSYFRIVGYDREIVIKAKTLMSKPFAPTATRSQMEPHPAILSFPRKRESKSWARAGYLLSQA